MKNGVKIEGRKGQKGRRSKYDISFRRSIAIEYSKGDNSLSQVAFRHGITRDQLRQWVKQFSCELSEEITIPKMTAEEQKAFEALEKELEQLKKKLEYEQMKNFALETMADLAQTELGIDIRKNFGAK